MAESPTCTAFVAYDSRPEINRDVLLRATTALRSKHLCDAVSWEELSVDGQLVVSQIMRAIQSAELCIADLTTLNPNVLFELGFAIAAGKRIWLLLEESDGSALELWKSFRLLSGVGYAAWLNSDDIVGRFATIQPHTVTEPLWPQLTEGAQPQDPSGIFFVPALYDSDANRALGRLLEAKRAEGFSLVASDPTESRLEPLSWYAERIYEASCVVVHLESQRRLRHEVHNARAALVAGLSAGSGRPLLMTAEADYRSPFDYQDILKRYRNADDCLGTARNWLADAPVEPRRRHERGRRRLSVELKDLRFGEHVAENEVQELPDYFVETSTYRELVHGGIAVYVGRKGSGKSANMYLAAAELQADHENLTVVIKPAAYDFAALVDLLNSLEGSLQQHAIEAVWKFVLLSEIARSAAVEIESRPSYLPLDASDREFLGFLDSTPFNIHDDVASRLELAIRRLTETGISGGGGVDERRRLSEALHEDWIRTLRDRIATIVEDRRRVAVLVDNLDKGWERKADLDVLSKLLLGLLSTVGRVEHELHRHDRQRRHALKVSLALFLRSDIYSYVVARAAREPDKIRTSRVEWTDPEVLITVLEQRFLATRPSDTSIDQLWSYFASTVRGQPTRDYILSRCLPRPRDLIFFANACVHTAIDRQRERIGEDEVLEAENLYSQFAFEALLVENGITIAELESVLFEFAGGSPAFEESEALALIEQAGPSGIRSEQVLRRLKEMSFFGIQTGHRIRYMETDREAERAEVLARKAAGGTAGAETVVVHPAFRAYLEISDVSL